MKFKKAYSSAIIILMFGIFILLMIFFESGFSQKHQKYIGERQLEIIETATNARKLNTYIDVSAKYSAFSVLHELASKTGNVYGTECGFYKGYAVLQNNDENGNTMNCFADDLKINMEALYNEKLENYFKSYGLLSPTYDINFEQKGETLTVIGRANSKIIFDLFGQKLLGVSVPLKYENTGTSAKDIFRDVIEAPQEEIEEENPLIEQPQTPITEKGKCPVQNLIELTDIACSSSISCQINSELTSLLADAQIAAESNGYSLLVTAAYRPYEVQDVWFNNGPPGHPDWAKDPSKVARPSCNSPHITGRAVDVILMDQNGNAISGMSSANTASMTNQNRRLLEKIMTDQGFVRYGNIEGTKGEFWHYEYKTSRWSRAVASSTDNKRVISIV